MGQSPRPFPLPLLPQSVQCHKAALLALGKGPLAWAGLGSRDTRSGIPWPRLRRPGMHPSCFKYSLGLQGLCCALMGWLVVMDLGYYYLLTKSTY